MLEDCCGTEYDVMVHLAEPNSETFWYQLRIELRRRYHNNGENSCPQL